MQEKMFLVIQYFARFTNGEHSPKFTQQVSHEYQRWLAERFIIA
jgi:hypothetical protein